ncbi:MAG: hypothetical protein ACE5FJ_04700 [Gemmatimonadales bacterium]
MNGIRKATEFGLLFVAAFCAGCGAEASTGPGGGGGGGGGGTGPATVTINMQNIAFVAPGGGDDVTVTLGDTIRWVNLDNIAHTATSTSVPTGGDSFVSGVLNNAGVFEFVPNVVGEWEYLCEIHPTLMFGATITVEP